MSVIKQILENQDENSLSSLMASQAGKELASSYLYTAMSYYSDSLSLLGFEKWFSKQAQEELTHYNKFIEYIKDRGFKVAFPPISAPPSSFSSPLEMWEETLKHEQEVTASIKNIYNKAVAVGDSQAQVFLHWFLNEQVEEEKTVSDILARVKMAIGSKESLLLIDMELLK